MTRQQSKESALVRQCLEYLGYLGIFAWRNNTVGIWDPVKKIFRKVPGTKGPSDILGILNSATGQMLAVECKIKPNKPTPEQEAFLQRVNDNGGIGLVAYSLDDLIKAVEERRVA